MVTLYNLPTKKQMKQNERKLSHEDWIKQSKWWEENLEKLVIDFYKKHPGASKSAAEYFVFNCRHVAMEERVGEILQRPNMKKLRNEFYIKSDKQR